MGFMGRLRRDARGNTLAIMAAALVPMCAFAGSAIDVARLYVVKTRLQTACDAGALAGRKFMDPSTAPNTTLTGTAGTQADSYFLNNFGSSWGASTWYTGTPTKTWTTFSDSSNITQVSGATSAQVPMTIMRMFGAATRIVAVNCQASFNTPDTDVMFVIDTTGSMACLPSDDPTADCGGSTSFTLPDGSTDYYDTEKSGSKLAAVRTAVDAFYTTLAANISKSGANVRYGFVPYSSTVNAGQALYSLDPAYLATNWTYQSRSPVITTSTSSSTSTTSSQSTCTAQAQAQTAYNSSGVSTSKTATYSTTTTGSGNNTTTTKYCTVATTTYTLTWTYQPVAYDTSGFIATLPNGGTVDDPSKVGSSTTSWQGCIDEASSGNYNNVSSYNIDALPADMNPDLSPGYNATTGTTVPTPWAPMWPAVEYGRNYSTSSATYSKTSTASSNGETTVATTTPNYINTTFRQNGFVPCGAPVQRLTAGQTQAQIDAYTAALHPHGGTYHDTGMIWGLRMLSPQGIFANDTAKWTGHADPKRVIVFLTDGAMSPDTRSYGMYGTEYFDSRISGNGTGVTSSTTGTLAAYHNARFLAECAKAQEKNIQVWVVAVGQALTPQLKTCVGTAHPERAVGPVTSSTDLSKAFTNIATAVSMLRVSQ